MRALQIPAPARRLVAVRDGAYCARCGRSILNYRASVHHRLARGMGGSSDERINDPRNLVQVCGSGVTDCHGWIHGHPTLALEHGWTVRSYDDLDTPMRTKFGSRITLSQNGEREDIWPFDDVLPE